MISVTDITLDLKNSQSYDKLIIHRDDKNSRKFCITLTDGGVLVKLTSDMKATVDASTNGVIVADGESATIDVDNNTINFIVTPNMTAITGIMKMSFTVTEGDTIITAQTIRANIVNSVINEDSKFEPAGGTVKQFMDEVAAARGDFKNLPEALSNKVDKADTLDGYGITNAYTKSETDKKFVYESKEIKSKISANIISGNYCTTNGEIASSTSFDCTEKFPLNDYTALSITSSYGYSAPLVVFFNAEGKGFSFAPELAGQKTIKVSNFEVDVPDGAKFAIVNRGKDIPIANFSVNGIREEAVTTNQKLSEISTSILTGKSLYVDGDSIMFGAGSNGYSVGEFLRDKYGMILTKAAVPDTTLAVREGKTNSICERISAISKKYDYIILDGSVNDINYGVALGGMTDSYKGDYNTKETIGALEQICYSLLTSNFEAKKLFVFTHKILDLNWLTIPTKLTSCYDALKKVLNKWGIPYVDICNESNLMAFNSSVNNKYFRINSSGEGDRVHPTKETYEKFYFPLIEKAIK